MARRRGVVAPFVNVNAVQQSSLKPSAAPILQLRAHFEDALKAGKPLVLGEFGKQHYSSMAVRRDFTARVYGEVEAWNAKHGNVAGERRCDCCCACTTALSVERGVFQLTKAHNSVC